MKKVSLKNKLSLNKEAITLLNNNQMSDLKGGEDVTTVVYTTLCPPSKTGKVCCVTLEC